MYEAHRSDVITPMTGGDELVHLMEVLKTEGLVQNLDLIVSPDRGGWVSFLLEYTSFKLDAAGAFCRKEEDFLRAHRRVLLVDGTGEILHFPSALVTEAFEQSCDLGLTATFEVDAIASIGHVWPKLMDIRRYQLQAFVCSLQAHAKAHGLQHFVLSHYEY